MFQSVASIDSMLLKTVTYTLESVNFPAATQFPSRLDGPLDWNVEVAGSGEVSA